MNGLCIFESIFGKGLMNLEDYSHFALFNNNQFKIGFDNQLFLGKKDSFEIKNQSDLNSFEDWFNDKKSLPIYSLLNYDIKNLFEDLKSQNESSILHPFTTFIQAEKLIPNYKLDPFSSLDLDWIKPIEVDHTKEEYIQKVKQIHEYILDGEVYELNFCLHFSGQVHVSSHLELYKKLNHVSSMPFSCLMKINDFYLICASPERFIQKRENKLISQPIKGTSKRFQDPIADLASKNALLASEKERAENLMIVDLVRNDLTRCSIPGTIKVEELFGLYSFPKVHQMISTVSSEVDANVSFKKILETTFPMGSMTGAPKIRAMEVIDELETRKRGVFSGSAGYFQENGDFDFNVIIRSILYDSKTQNISFSVGSAITIDSDPEKEYDECMLKAEAILNTLGLI